VGIQIGSGDPDVLASAVKVIMSSPYKYNEINLNCGCPSVKIGACGGGAEMMLSPEVMHITLTKNLIHY
jgi:tRNA-dihydrouridine synthase A